MKVEQLHQQSPKQLSNPTPTPKPAHQDPIITSKTTPKLSKNQISKLTKTQKMKVVQLHEWTPTQFLSPKIAQQGPQKSKMTPVLSQNEMSEFKVTQKMKIFQLHEQTLKQCLPKNIPLGPQKVKNDLKIKSKSNVRIERNKENESCSAT